MSCLCSSFSFFSKRVIDVDAVGISRSVRACPSLLFQAQPRSLLEHGRTHIADGRMPAPLVVQLDNATPTILSLEKSEPVASVVRSACHSVRNDNQRRTSGLSVRR